MKRFFRSILSVFTAAVIAVTGLVSVTASAAGTDIDVNLKSQTDGSKLVELKPSDDDNYITYTTDGSVPDPESELYEEPVLIEETSVVRAAEFDEDDNCINRVKFSVKVRTPTPRSTREHYDGYSIVTMTCPAEDALIYYTTDGSAPSDKSKLYKGAITIYEETTFKFCAYKEGCTKSFVSSRTVGVKKKASSSSSSSSSRVDDMGTMTGGIGAGDNSNNSSVSQNNDMGSGSQDTSYGGSSSEGLSSSTTVSSSTTKPSTTTSASTSTTTKPGTSSSSSSGKTVISTGLTVPITPAADPTISNNVIKMNVEYFPLKSTSYVALTARSPKNAIYYTTDGSTPSLKNGKKYSGKIAVKKKTLFRAAEYDSSGKAQASVKCYVVLQCQPVRAEITGYPGKGMATVRLVCDTPGVTIYYTTDGTNPDPKYSPRYEKEFQIAFKGGVWAIAVHNEYRACPIQKVSFYDMPLAIDEFNFDDPVLQEVTDLVNKYRAEQGLNPLVLDRQVTRAAYKRAKEVAIDGNEARRPSNMSWMTALSEEEAYYLAACYAYGKSYSKEEIARAAAYRTGDSQNPKYNQLGVGYYKNANGQTLWYLIVVRDH